jgi:hypothetical protein
MSGEYPCIYFEKDGKCRKFSDDTAISYCVIGPCSEQKLSNADQIRTMGDEKLADWTAKFVAGIFVSLLGEPRCGVSNLIDDLKTSYLAWLQQPAEEDT